MKKILAEIKSLIENHSLDLAADKIIKNSIDCTPEFLMEMKQSRLLQISNYNFNCDLNKELLKKITSHELYNETTNDFKEYCVSINSLLGISFSVRSISNGLYKRLKNINIVDYLVTVQKKFYENRLPFQILNENVPGLISTRSPEDLVEAFSTCFYHMKDSNSDIKIDFLNLDVSGNISGKCEAELSEIQCISDYKDLETYIDWYEYSAFRDKSHVHLNHNNEELIKSIDQGFTSHTQTVFAKQVLFYETDRNGSFFQLIKQLYDMSGSDFFLLRGSGKTERVIFKFPIIDPLIEIINSDKLFEEELFQYMVLEEDCFITNQIFSRVPIYQKLTLFDILKWKRLWTLHYLMFEMYCKDKNILNKRPYLNSMVPHMPRSTYDDLMSQYFGKDVADELSSFLTWKGNGKFDLQYQPVIEVNNEVLIPSGIIAHSNLLRNSLKLSKFRVDADGSNTPIEDELEKVLLKHKINVVKGFKYSYSGIDGQIDLLFVIDKTLFIFECKNSLAPVDIHELKTTMGHIETARVQLDRFKSLSSDPTFIKYLNQRLVKYSMKFQSNIRTAVVIGNRTLYGYSIGGHPIRSLYDMCQFIDEGRISINALDGDGARHSRVYCLWAGSSFQESDMVSYLKNDFIHGLFLKNLVSVDYVYRFKSKKVIKKKYLLNVKSLAAELGKRFPYLDN